MSLVNKVKHVRVTARRRPGDLGRIRVALCAVFAAHGFIFASWAVRVPAIKEQVGASSAALGLALLGLSAGAVATMLLAGALCRRFGGLARAGLGGLLAPHLSPLRHLLLSGLVGLLVSAVAGHALLTRDAVLGQGAGAASAGPAAGAPPVA